MTPLAVLFDALLALLAPLPQQADRASLPTLRIVTPLDESDAQQLDAYWRDHAIDLGVSASVVRVVEPTSEELRAGTLLLGYERGLLDEIVPAITVHRFALQSWCVAASHGEGADPAAVDSFAGLLDPTIRARAILRRLTEDSSEGLVLGELARRAGRVEDESLRDYVLVSEESGSARSKSASFDRLLAGLPGGAVTLVPLRSAERARRAGLPIGWTLPREGFPQLELAAGLTDGSAPELVRWFDEQFEREVAPQLCGALELEPDGPLPAAAPEWMKLAVASRFEIDRGEAGVVRDRLARLANATRGPPASEADDDGLQWLDGVLLTGALVFLAGFAWRSRRNSRPSGVV